MPSQGAASNTDNQGTPKAGLLVTNKKSFRDEATMHGIANCSPAAPLPSTLQLSTTAAAGGRLWAAVPAGAAGRPRWLSSAAPAPAAPCSTGNSHCSSLMRGARGHESMSACRNGCRQQPHPDQKAAPFGFAIACHSFMSHAICYTRAQCAHCPYCAVQQQWCWRQAVHLHAVSAHVLPRAVAPRLQPLLKGEPYLCGPDGRGKM